MGFKVGTTDKLMKGPSAPGAAKPKSPADFDYTQGLKKKAAKQALGVAEAAQGAVGSMEAAQAAGMQAIQGQSAEGLATGQAAAGRFGGSAYGGALQAGKDAGLAQAEFGYGAAGKLADAKTEAAQAALGATEYERELGTTTEDRAAALKDINESISTAIDNASGWSGTDEAAAAAAIRALKAGVSDPVILAEIERQAQQQEANDWV